jgi:transcriptional regulator with XRE-family HTH domain
VAAGSAPRRTLGDVIRERRESYKLSLRQLASMSNVSNAYLSQVERGLHEPSIRVLRGIADALEMSWEQMLSQAGLPAESSSDKNEDSTSTERAIKRDPRLSAGDRETLLALYRRLSRRET